MVSLLIGAFVAYIGLAIFHVWRSEGFTDLSRFIIEDLRSERLETRFVIVVFDTVFFLGIFLFGSPLFALSGLNYILGRPIPHGRLARWYEEIALRRRARRPP